MTFEEFQDEVRKLIDDTNDDVKWKFVDYTDWTQRSRPNLKYHYFAIYDRRPGYMVEIIRRDDHPQNVEWVVILTSNAIAEVYKSGSHQYAKGYGATLQAALHGACVCAKQRASAMEDLMEELL